MTEKEFLGCISSAEGGASAGGIVKNCKGKKSSCKPAEGLSAGLYREFPVDSEKIYLRSGSID